MLLAPMAQLLLLLAAWAPGALGLRWRFGRSATTGRTCTEKSLKYFSGCMEDKWVDEMVRTDPSGVNKVFVDVGCNTGIDAVKWMERWGPEPGVLSKWSRLTMASVGQGVCGQNVVFPKFFNSRRGRKTYNPRVLCVEALPSNARVLQTYTRTVFGPNSTNFEVVHAAASDHEGVYEFQSDIPAGFEQAGIGSAKQAWAGEAMTKVRMLTVDQMLAERGIKQVDVLSIDTEGHDPSVLWGAGKTLKAGLVRYLVFEVHQDLPGSAWSRTSLTQTIKSLDDLGYECYWAGDAGDLQLLTGCFTEAEERRSWPLKWSNVACVKRGDPWAEVLRKWEATPTPMAVRALRWASIRKRAQLPAPKK